MPQSHCRYLLPKQTQDSLHSCAAFLTSSTSQYLKWCTTPPLVSPHHFIQHLALWGRLQAPVEVCVAARCNTSPRGPSARRRRTTLAGLRLSSSQCSPCINIRPQLSRIQKGLFFIFSGRRVGAVFCVSVYGEEWVHPCLKMMMHCSMERVCSCGHILVQEQFRFMVILRTFWMDYCDTEHWYWFNLVHPFLSSCEQYSVVER